MKPLRERTWLFGVFLTVFVFSVGSLVGCAVAAYLYHRHVFSWAAADSAADINWQLRTVSHLRLGEINEAIELIEEQIDYHIVALAQTKGIAKIDYADHALREAKTYRDLYPPNSPDSSKAIRVLEGYPKLETFKCHNSLARLVERSQLQKRQ